MKKLITSLFVFLVVFSASSQDIPNASFENWHPYSAGEYPDFWTTSDSISVFNSGGTSVSKTTDSYDGTYAIKLKSVSVVIFGFPTKGPGFATNGNIALVGTNIVFSGGSPDTSRSRFFTARYKYFPANPLDAAYIKVHLMKWNSTTSSRDTIATGVHEITGDHTTYDQLILPLVYKDFIEQPDSCLITLQSSRNVNDAYEGTELIVDSLGFSGFVGIEELKKSIRSVNVFPVPADNELNIDVVLNNPLSLTYEIYDNRGRLIASDKLNSTNEKVDVSTLANGKYILKLGDAKKNHLYSASFSITR